MVLTWMIVVAVGLGVGLLASLFMTAPGIVKCGNCGSHKTYHTTKESIDTHRPGTTHVNSILVCWNCKREKVFKSKKVETTDLEYYRRR